MSTVAPSREPIKPASVPEFACSGWRQVWRKGLAPQLSPAHLLALEAALAADSPELLQGATCSPPPLMSEQHKPVRAACALSYLAWRGRGLATVAQVEEAFAEACWLADQLLGQRGEVRHFLNWWDETARAEALPALLGEVRRSLASAVPTAPRPWRSRAGRAGSPIPAVYP